MAGHVISTWWHLWGEGVTLCRINQLFSDWKKIRKKGWDTYNFSLTVLFFLDNQKQRATHMIVYRHNKNELRSPSLKWHYHLLHSSWTPMCDTWGIPWTQPVSYSLQHPFVPKTPNIVFFVVFHIMNECPTNPIHALRCC